MTIHPDWLAHQQEPWERGQELREQGYTLAQAYSMLGLLPAPPDEPTRMQDLPAALRNQLMDQAKAQLIHQLRGASIERWPGRYLSACRNWLMRNWRESS